MSVTWKVFLDFDSVDLVSVFYNVVNSFSFSEGDLRIPAIVTWEDCLSVEISLKNVVK